MKINKDIINLLLEMVKQDTIPAIGCTEPVAVAYASSAAKKYSEGPIKSISVIVSLSIFKNGKSVIIPNTNEYGLDLAAALGAICGNPDDGLCVFKNVNDEHINMAHDMISKKIVNISWAADSSDVFVKVIINSNNNVEVVLKNSHSHIETIRVDDELVYEDISKADKKMEVDFLEKLTFTEIREICEEIDIDHLKFIEEGIQMNMLAAHQGLKNKKGLGWGATLLSLQNKGRLSTDASQRARILTAAGADIRMGGGDCPIMTSGGSGNQGLGVIIPIVVVAEDRGIEKEKLYRAIFYAHIINKFVKQYTGKLSALCGCAIAAGVGASAAITWMLGGNDRQIAGSVQNMIANLTGMICDGAKETCALKLSTSAGEAVISAYLACENVIAKANTGILGGTVEETIRRLGVLCKKGLVSTNEVIVEMME